MAASLAKSLWILPTIASFLYIYPYEKTNKFEEFKAETEGVEEVYDFVVIGGGTAGCVLANRLSEDPSVSVLLLEAGGKEPYEAQIPAVAPYLQLTEIDWQFQSSPSSTSCLAMKGNRCNLPRGKVLGGSSSINFMLYVRGNKNDFDQWESFGNPGWSYDEVLRYFIRSEDNKDVNLLTNSSYHGVGGYQIIKSPPWKTPLADAFLEAGRELGYPTIDINGEMQSGFMFPQAFYYNGGRYSSSRAFLYPIQDRPNLKIKLHANVTRLQFTNDKRVTGVSYEKNNKSFSVTVKREVILSAGAFGSPHILMLSGIGPASHLKSVGIKPLVDLPVGRNLQDHIAGQLPFLIDKAMSLKRARLESFGSIYQYILWGSGPLATLGGVEGIGFADTKYSNRSAHWPDVQFHFISGSYASDSGMYLRHTLNLRDEYWEKYFKPLSDLDCFTILVKLMRPRSKGFIELNATNPKEMPKIVTNYLTEPSDVVILTEGLKIAKALGETKALKKLGSVMYNKPIPGCEKFRVRSDRYWECFLRHMTLTIYHYSGTAKMGPYWDPEAVVDPELRVYSTSGLRVVDASIFPTITTGNINAAVMMVAEKASDLIKSFWEQPKMHLAKENSYSKANKSPSRPSSTSHRISKRESGVDRPRLKQKSLWRKKRTSPRYTKYDRILSDKNQKEDEQGQIEDREAGISGILSQTRHDFNESDTERRKNLKFRSSKWSNSSSRFYLEKIIPKSNDTFKFLFGSDLTVSKFPQKATSSVINNVFQPSEISTSKHGDQTTVKESFINQSIPLLDGSLNRSRFPTVSSLETMKNSSLNKTSSKSVFSKWVPTTSRWKFNETSSEQVENWEFWEKEHEDL